MSKIKNGSQFWLPFYFFNLFQIYLPIKAKHSINNTDDPLTIPLYRALSKKEVLLGEGLELVYIKLFVISKASLSIFALLSYVPNKFTLISVP